MELGKQFLRLCNKNMALGLCLDMLRLLAIFFAVLSSVQAAPATAKGKGTPGIPGINPVKKAKAVESGQIESGELNKMRVTMRKFWCADGTRATQLPCQVHSFNLKLAAEKDAEKKKVMLEARKKEVAADTTIKTRSKKEFWGMFDGYCAAATSGAEKDRICTNKLMLRAKSAGRMPTVAD